MNKQEYLTALEKALKAASVSELSDILDEYSEHFDMKQADGYDEEEIAARLASPDSIAKQYSEIVNNNSERKSNQASKVITMIGLILSDFIALMFFIIMYAWVVVFGVFSLSSAVLGVMTITGINELYCVALIPYMPYLCALFLGIALLALTVLSAIGTEYCRLYVTQLAKVYVHWYRTVLLKSGNISPPLSAHPKIAPKKRRLMRSITLISLAVFSISFIVGLGAMMLISGSLEPWHVWQWFN